MADRPRVYDQDILDRLGVDPWSPEWQEKERAAMIEGGRQYRKHRAASLAGRDNSPKWQAYLERMAARRALKSRPLNPDCFPPLWVPA